MSSGGCSLFFIVLSVLHCSQAEDPCEHNMCFNDGACEPQRDGFYECQCPTNFWTKLSESGLIYCDSFTEVIALAYTNYSRNKLDISIEFPKTPQLNFILNSNLSDKDLHMVFHGNKLIVCGTAKCYVSNYLEEVHLEDHDYFRAISESNSKLSRGRNTVATITDKVLTIKEKKTNTILREDASRSYEGVALHLTSHQSTRLKLKENNTKHAVGYVFTNVFRKEGSEVQLRDFPSIGNQQLSSDKFIMNVTMLVNCRRLYLFNEDLQRQDVDDYHIINVKMPQEILPLSHHIIRRGYVLRSLKTHSELHWFLVSIYSDNVLKRKSIYLPPPKFYQESSLITAIYAPSLRFIYEAFNSKKHRFILSCDLDGDCYIVKSLLWSKEKIIVDYEGSKIYLQNKENFNLRSLDLITSEFVELPFTFNRMIYSITGNITVFNVTNRFVFTLMQNPKWMLHQTFTSSFQIFSDSQKYQVPLYCKRSCGWHGMCVIDNGYEEKCYCLTGYYSKYHYGACRYRVCKNSEFNCYQSGLCIPKTKLCDGRDDCGHGEDESPHSCLKCQPHEVRCLVGNIGNCIQRSKISDGLQDCDNGVDESFKKGCNLHEFKCDGKCKSIDIFCNGMIECKDKSDEGKCMGCGEDHFECGNSKCILKKYICDGHQDCENGIDENTKTCTYNSSNVADHSQEAEQNQCDGNNCKFGLCFYGKECRCKSSRNEDCPISLSYIDTERSNFELGVVIFFCGLILIIVVAITAGYIYRYVVLRNVSTPVRYERYERPSPPRPSKSNLEENIQKCPDDTFGSLGEKEKLIVDDMLL